MVLARKPRFVAVPLVLWAIVLLVPALASTAGHGLAELFARATFLLAASALTGAALVELTTGRVGLSVSERGLHLHRDVFRGPWRETLLPWSDILRAKAITVAVVPDAVECLLVEMRPGAQKPRLARCIQLLEIYSHSARLPGATDLLLIQNDQWEWSPADAAVMIRRLADRWAIGRDVQ